ncbi:MAG TPA: TioE family transcriptional regulator [Stackebrandtia sp.]|uniref:TioE family transcriptional regulator n=1 Tax=Stackebrandtia sp. TaxID=2023065 RepID=UPI002D560791|nr:TioE family transcriptional regulator [Stackebrandtia sp.]HZE40550.1 TioE family transcriptional regulator [Stackebrandtia sp.]
METLRPADLAREHALSTQAVRNYERDGFIPPAERTRSGYRVYTAVHAAALRTFLALVAAHGRAGGGEIMIAIHDGRLDDALGIVAVGHRQLLHDRSTLESVRSAADHLTSVPDTSRPETLTVGELAHRLGVTPATLRNWEDVGILTPARDPVTDYRVYVADDVRDAELARLLRRGGYPLDHIATVVEQVRGAGGTRALAAALEDWRRRLTARGRALLRAAARLDDYLGLRETPTPLGPVGEPRFLLRAARDGSEFRSRS